MSSPCPKWRRRRLLLPSHVHGVGRAVRWVHRAQVSRVGGLVGDVLETGWRWASVYAHCNGYTGLGI